MENTNKLIKDPETIAKTLTENYADHGFCINIEEAKEIGLNVHELNGDLLNLVLEFYHLYKDKEKTKIKLKKLDMNELFGKLPPELTKEIIDDLS